MKNVDIRGLIVTNELKEVADYYGMESTAPYEVAEVIATLEEGEELSVAINSGGGYVSAGQEIYSALYATRNVTAHVNSMAASAASLIAMGADRVIMTPASQLMIHNVSMSGWLDGDYHEYDRAARRLKDANAAIALAYQAKTGLSKEKILNLMDKETWLPSDRALELGFADEVSEPAAMFTNFTMGQMFTPEMIEKARRMIAARTSKERDEEARKQNILHDLYLYG